MKMETLLATSRTVVNTISPILTHIYKYYTIKSSGTMSRVACGVHSKEDGIRGTFKLGWLQYISCIYIKFLYTDF